ncbi:hypothetical protein UFOVP12_21 [uncultured Caudovirales phage]|uniref:Uncharacterized protein n=1 Tax=uncultured Caudovirales phage TaxID=2100421 RepID=A0A6J5KJ25_9CAUD|nr:hypothetical protein UFOVP12_21 [uncultured Caudovirales phage]
MEKIEINLQTGKQTVIKLTDEEIAQVQTAAKAIEEAIPYYEKRRDNYPPITDYLDGVVKGNQAQIDAYIAACKAVKEKYPKTVGI